MNHSVKIGFCFGSTSGIITTLGLMVGLNSGTHSKLVVIGGILTIAIADAFLADYDWTDWRSLSKDEKHMVNGWKSTFDDYNNGDIGPGHCDD